MKARRETRLGRRDLLRAVVTGAAVAAAATGAVAAEPAAVTRDTKADKRKARYQANSAEVQRFYQVNRYPGK